jgi:hypothetical protein
MASYLGVLLLTVIRLSLRFAPGIVTTLPLVLAGLPDRYFQQSFRTGTIVGQHDERAQRSDEGSEHYA